jgi:cell division protein FtsQ
MKVNWNYIKAFLVLALVVFLFGFAEKRNNNRKINNVAINFVDDENLYVTHEIVNKLLIQNNEKVKNASKEAIALKDVENRIDNHDMIADSDVYLTVNGTLGVTVKQRKPIARVSHQKAFYIDEEGKIMPLSKFHSARVPLVYHISEKDIDVLFPLLKYITKDVFLTKHVTAIQKTSKGTYNLQLRDVDFEVDFGHIEDIDRKVNNLKAFYQKALKDKKLNLYSKVNLQFGSQVVCTKKE